MKTRARVWEDRQACCQRLKGPVSKPTPPGSRESSGLQNLSCIPKQEARRLVGTG